MMVPSLADRSPPDGLMMPSQTEWDVQDLTPLLKKTQIKRHHTPSDDDVRIRRRTPVQKTTNHSGLVRTAYDVGYRLCLICDHKHLSDVAAVYGDGIQDVFRH